MPKPDDKEKGATKQANMIEGSSTGDENYGKRKQFRPWEK